MTNEISQAVKSGHGNAIIYTAALALVFADAIPTPADAVYFQLEKKLRDDWDAGKLTAQQYWTKKSLYYFLPDVIWWSGVLTALYLTGGTFTDKLKVGIGLVGAGAVATIIYQNMKKDILLQSQKNKDVVK